MSSSGEFLYGRMNGAQEQFLVRWILDEDNHGHPPSRSRVYDMAARILWLNNDFKPLGRWFVQELIRQHPQLAPVLPSRGPGIRIQRVATRRDPRFFFQFGSTRVFCRHYYDSYRPRYPNKTYLGRYVVAKKPLIERITIKTEDDCSR